MTKVEAQKLSAYWQHKLGLCNWDIEWEFNYVEMVPFPDNENRYVYGCCITMPEYFVASITIATKHPKDVIENTIRHELAHVLTSELKLSIKDYDESLWLALDESIARRIAKAF